MAWSWSNSSRTSSAAACRVSATAELRWRLSWEVGALFLAVRETVRVRLGGGASAVRQYLQAGLLDEMHIAVVPVLLGGGERLFEDVGNAATAMEVVEFVSSPSVMHVRMRKH